MSLRTLVLALALAFSVEDARAGFIEISASGSARRVNIDQNAYDEMTALTGSLSYYFDEMSAIELSYTDGSSKRFIGSTNNQDRTTWVYYKLIGLDFVYTVGDRASAIRPYIKGGAVYIMEKRFVDQFQGFPATISQIAPTVVPSVGAGIKISLTANLSIKTGVDAWMSGNANGGIDYAARAGLSWMF